MITAQPPSAHSISSSSRSRLHGGGLLSNLPLDVPASQPVFEAAAARSLASGSVSAIEVPAAAAQQLRDDTAGKKLSLAATMRAHRLPVLNYVVVCMQQSFHIARPDQRLPPVFSGRGFCHWALLRFRSDVVPPSTTAAGLLSSSSSMNSGWIYMAADQGSAAPSTTTASSTNSATAETSAVTADRLEYILTRFLKSVAAAQRLGELLLKHGYIEVYGLPWPLAAGPRDGPFNLETHFCLAQQHVQRHIGTDSELISFADRMSDPLFGVPSFVHVGSGPRARACWQVIDGVDWILAYAQSNQLSWSRHDALQILQCLLRLKLIYPVDLPEWDSRQQLADSDASSSGGSSPTVSIHDDHSLFSLSVRVNRQLKPLFSREQIHRVCKSMRRPLSRGGLNVQDRRHFFRVHQQCFLAADAVDWLSQHLRLTFAEAVVLANWMLGHGLFVPAEPSNGKSFRDPSGWYRFRTNSRVRDYLLLMDAPSCTDSSFDDTAADAAATAGTDAASLPPTSAVLLSNAPQTDAMTGLPYASSGALASGSANYNWVYATVVHTEARLLLYESTIASEPATVIDLPGCFLQIRPHFECRLIADDHIYTLRLRSHDQFQLWTRALTSLMASSIKENEAFETAEQNIAVQETAAAQQAVERELALLAQSRGSAASPPPSSSSSSSTRHGRRDRAVSDLHSVPPPPASALARLLSPFTSPSSSSLR